MEYRNAGVPENKRTYSSVYNDDKIGTGHARSAINSPQGWTAKTSKAGEWIQMDLGRARWVVGTRIQPRAYPSLGQYVSEYTVSTSLDGKSWAGVTGVYKGLDSQAYQNFFFGRVRVRARYVRMIVQKWHGRVSLRADVLVFDDGMSKEYAMVLCLHVLLSN